MKRFSGQECLEIRTTDFLGTDNDERKGIPGTGTGRAGTGTGRD